MEKFRESLKKDSLLMIDQDLALDLDMDLESEYGPVSSEPYDPNLADALCSGF